MAKGDGHKQITTDEEGGIYSGSGMARRVRKPSFARELITAGSNALDSVTRAVFRDEQALNNACLYIGHMSMFEMEDEVDLALLKINGTMAIDGLSRDQASQVDIGVWFPKNLSKDDKEKLAKLQSGRNRREEENNQKEGE